MARLFHLVLFIACYFELQCEVGGSVPYRATSPGGLGGLSLGSPGLGSGQYFVGWRRRLKRPMVAVLPHPLVQPSAVQQPVVQPVVQQPVVQQLPPLVQQAQPLPQPPASHITILPSNLYGDGGGSSKVYLPSNYYPAWSDPSQFESVDSFPNWSNNRQAGDIFSWLSGLGPNAGGNSPVNLLNNVLGSNVDGNPISKLLTNILAGNPDASSTSKLLSDVLGLPGGLLPDTQGLKSGSLNQLLGQLNPFANLGNLVQKGLAKQSLSDADLETLNSWMNKLNKEETETVIPEMVDEEELTTDSDPVEEDDEGEDEEEEEEEK